MHTNNTNQENLKTGKNTGFESAMKACGINLQQFGIDPQKGVHGGGEVLSNGALMIRVYKGRCAKIWFYRAASGTLCATIKYVKTGKRMCLPIKAIDQVPWRTLDQTFEAAAEHGYLRLKRDRQAEREAVEQATLALAESENAIVTDTLVAEVA